MSAGHRRPQILAKTNPPTGHQQMETVPAETVAEAAADLQLTVAWVLGPRRSYNRPIAVARSSSRALRCGPSEETFAAPAKSRNSRTHTVRTEVPFAAYAEGRLYSHHQTAHL